MSDLPKRWGFRMVIAGALAQGAGLAIDAYKHLKDPTLASREALLTFENVGHVLLIGGIALVLAGLGLMFIGPRLLAAAPPIRVGVPLVLALVVGGASVAAANSSLSRGHDHGAASEGISAAGADHGHGDGTEPPYEPVDAATRAELAEQLVQAREVALRYPTVADAERAGYRKVTEYVPLIGAHYMRFLLVDGTFDIAQPEMLLYDGTEPGSQMVGLSYYVTADSEPEGFAGPNDHWHQHIGLCIDANAPVVIGDESLSDEECAAIGGRKADGRDGWMVHAWVVPGWESPQGVFSAENEQLT